MHSILCITSTNVLGKIQGGGVHLSMRYWSCGGEPVTFRDHFIIRIPKHDLELSFPEITPEPNMRVPLCTSDGV